MASSSDLEEQLDVWSKVASSLEEKLEIRADDNDRLKRNLQCKQEQYEDLQQECNYKTAKIADLQEQRKKDSAKVVQLSEILEARQPNEVQRKLIEKSMQYAENAHRIDTLQSEVQKTKSEKQGLLEERDSLSASNAELWRRLEHATSTIDKMKQEREKNNKMLLGLGDIVRTLNCLSVDYQTNSDEIEDCADRPHGQAVKNIKRKIEAFENDRQNLRKECKALRDENASKDAKISALESHFHSVNIDRVDSPSDNSGDINDAPKRNRNAMPENHSSQVDQETTQRDSTPIAVDRAVLKPSVPLEDDEESSNCRRSESSSDDSSFSTLDPPDVPMEK
jgi:DNA repair exonuclease SbcCD ATPase subunit